jgi:hypothetical protein
MTKSAKIFFLVYILGSIIALVLSQIGRVPSKPKPGDILAVPLTISAIQRGI